MSRLSPGVRRWLSYLLLPLSALPLLAIVPLISDAHSTFQREHHSGPLAPPRVALDAAVRERFQPVPEYRDAVPVVVYQGVSDKGGAGTVSRRQFATQMALLEQMRFNTISIDEYVRWREGRGELPPRPILVTFDGARLDTYRGADAILERNGQRATIFVATGAIGAGDAAVLTWRELKSMVRSARWDVQSGGHDARGRVVAGSDGALAPFFAARRYTASRGVENLADFERRVTVDLFAAKDTLENHGIAVRAIALPGGDYGQLAGNDSRIAPLVSGLLARQFPVAFVRVSSGQPAYTTRGAAAERYGVTATTTLAALGAWLRASSPAAIALRARKDAAQKGSKTKATRSGLES